MRKYGCSYTLFKLNRKQYTFWSLNTVCKAPDLFLWNSAFTLINLIYVFALIKKHFPTFIPSYLMNYYTVVLKPLLVSQKVCKCIIIQGVSYGFQVLIHETIFHFIRYLQLHILDFSFFFNRYIGTDISYLIHTTILMIPFFLLTNHVTRFYCLQDIFTHYQSTILLQIADSSTNIEYDSVINLMYLCYFLGLTQVLIYNLALFNKCPCK